MSPPPFQLTLLNREPPALDRSFSRLTRLALDPRSWIDHAPSWLAGSDTLFEELLDSRDWEIAEPVVALVSLGEPRKFLVRPRGGGQSLAFTLGRGDLLVTGGRAQRDWEHSVPKVARAGPRISLAFGHGLDPRAYEGTATPPR